MVWASRKAKARQKSDDGPGEIPTSLPLSPASGAARPDPRPARSRRRPPSPASRWCSASRAIPAAQAPAATGARARPGQIGEAQSLRPRRIDRVQDRAPHRLVFPRRDARDPVPPLGGRTAGDLVHLPWRTLRKPPSLAPPPPRSSATFRRTPKAYSPPMPALCRDCLTTASTPAPLPRLRQPPRDVAPRALSSSPSPTWIATPSTPRSRNATIPSFATSPSSSAAASAASSPPPATSRGSRACAPPCRCSRR
jgi:hypothetical protein